MEKCASSKDIKSRDDFEKYCSCGEIIKGFNGHVRSQITVALPLYSCGSCFRHASLCLYILASATAGILYGRLVKQQQPAAPLRYVVACGRLAAQGGKKIIRGCKDTFLH